MICPQVTRGLLLSLYCLAVSSLGWSGCFWKRSSLIFSNKCNSKIEAQVKKFAELFFKH